MRISQRLLFVLALSSPALATDFWVDAVNGSDANTGLSIGGAFQTITRALNQLPPGVHVVHVQPGTYDSALGEVFPLSVPTGTVIAGEGGSAMTLVDAPALASSVFVLAGNGSNRIVRGFTLTGGQIGLSIIGDSGAADVTGVDLVISDTSTGVFYFSNDTSLFALPRLTFSNVEIFDCGVGLRILTEAITTLELFMSDSTIRDCTGIGFFDDHWPSDGPAVDLDFHRCRFVNNGSIGMSLANASGEAAVLQDCLVAGNATGISTVENLEVTRSTIAHNAVAGYRNVTTPGTILTMTRSIVYGNGDDISGSPTGIVSDTDIGDGDFPGFPGNFAADPLFRDPANGDYRLTAPSPCVDVLPASNSGDIDGIARRSDGDLDTVRGADLGAFEMKTLEAVGSASLGTTVQLELQGHPGTYGTLFFSLTLVPPLPTVLGEFELPLMSMFGFSRFHMPAGNATVPFPIPNVPVYVGTSVHFQAIARSIGAPFAAAVTDAVTVTAVP